MLTGQPPSVITGVVLTIDAAQLRLSAARVRVIVRFALPSQAVVVIAVEQTANTGLAQLNIEKTGPPLLTAVVCTVEQQSALHRSAMWSVLHVWLTASSHLGRSKGKRYDRRRTV
jgi:hypothetical protein